MIQESEIRRAITVGECETGEFKEQFRSDHGNTLAAFANDYAARGGGLMLVGVNEKGVLVGIRQDRDELQRLVADVCRSSIEPKIFPEVEFRNVDGVDTLAIRVARSHQRPHRFRGRCYLRLGSTTREATFSEGNEIASGVVHLPFDMTPVDSANADDLNYEAFQSYYSTTRTADSVALNGRGPQEVALNLDFLVESGGTRRPTVAALLLFGKNPQRILPSSSLNAIRFRGTTRADEILSRHEIKGPADQLIRDGTYFIKSNMLIASQFHGPGIKRTDIEEYPEWAIREAVANAVVHRDYSNRGAQIDIYMFDDRVEVLSPGPLGGGLTVEDLGKKRFLRNPKIAEVLFELKYIEKAGTGIARIRELLKRNGSEPPDFVADANSVLAILKAHPFYTARRRLEEAQKLRIAGDLDKAVSLLTEAIEINPKYADAHFTLATIYEDMNRFPEARKNYQRATEISPTFSPAFLAWAKLEDRLNNVSVARNLFRTALESSPGDFAVTQSWAMMEKKLGNLPKAYELLSPLEKRRPNDPVVLQSLGQVEFSRGNYNAADRLLNRALNVAENDFSKAWITCDLARLYEAMNRPNKEIQALYEESIRLNPNTGETHRYYGRFLQKIGQPEKARSHLALATEFGFREARRRGPRRRRRQ